MDRILLGAEILPWKDPVSGEVNEASRVLEIIVRKFERLHPDKG